MAWRFGWSVWSWSRWKVLGPPVFRAPVPLPTSAPPANERIIERPTEVLSWLPLPS
ncbi:hypothetical protein M758_3G267800 [Ceratodon purpureus]|nr:hypothetical protein M758_3G267800 [Ceratodon purpureus]